ncbi:uncharacterized protein BDV17DRAFT_271762 [Aspergillus undulatus]|uniref:uncharacterized protein n=1 Tax=Aspergillus undulatus TaxID=1810928 RepID=UPI003CCDF663
MPEKWQRLCLANVGPIPSLLFKYSTTSSGYELYLTDLNYIWFESLDRKAILKRADEYETVIDPSQDLEQFKVLLQKIGKGLQNEPGSKTSLKPSTRASTHALELTVTSELPTPLRPLKWKHFLSKEPQSSTTSHLLLPFIKAEADREARQRSLIEELNKKDWVLAKLFDKIEAMGIDLSTIFPGTSGLRGGRKGPTLAQAAKYIKGLAPFDEQSWREEASKSSSDVGLSVNIVAEMFGQSDSLQPPPDGWWESISISEGKGPPAPREDNKSKPVTQPSLDAMEVDIDPGSETEDDDEFERQETPPRFKKFKQSAPQKDEDQETQSDDDLEEARSPKRKRVEDHPPPAMRPKAAPTGKSKRLGKIGGKNKTNQKSPSPLSPTPSPLPSPIRTPEPPRKHQMPPALKPDEDETTDGETDASADEESRKPQASPKSNNKDADNDTTRKSAPRPCRGLGVIGGKKKQKQPTPQPEPEAEPEPESSNTKASQSQHRSQSQSQSTTEPQQSQQPAPPPKKKKLGAIGGKAKSKTSTNTTETPTPSQTESVSPPAPKTQSHQKQDRTDNEEAKRIEETPAPQAKKEAKEETPAEPESELTEEKANKKREELKRQLAAKSKAPAKKKRRF